MQPDSNIPKGYCQCGCGEKTKIAIRTDSLNHYIKGQPKRCINGHNIKRRYGKTAIHLKPENAYVVNETTGCWEWQRSKTEDGYGKFWDGKQFVRAHRYFYEKYKGPIPEDLQLDHKCRNRGCCNPGHLEAVTGAMNVQRGIKAKMNWEKVIKLRKLRREERLTYTALGELFHISKNQAWLIGQNKNWVEQF